MLSTKDRQLDVLREQVETLKTEQANQQLEQDRNHQVVMHNTSE